MAPFCRHDLPLDQKGTSHRGKMRLGALLLLSLCVALACVAPAASAVQEERLESDELWFHLDDYLAQSKPTSRITRAQRMRRAAPVGLIEENAQDEAQDFATHSANAQQQERDGRAQDRQKLWFHLDDYMTEAEAQARRQHEQLQRRREQDKDEEMEEADGDDERPPPKEKGMELNDKKEGGDATEKKEDKDDGEDDDGEGGAKAKAKAEAGGAEGVKESKFSAAREFNGGATNVLANKNYMSVMENADGEPISPDAAREEARLEAAAAHKKQKLEESRKSHSEAGRKAVARKRHEQGKEQSKKKVGEEVRKAQELAKKTSEREKNEAAKKAEQRTREQNKKKEHHINLKAPTWKQPAQGNSYQPARADTWGPYCILSGMAYSTGGAGLLGVLPANCRPSGRIMFSVTAGGRACRLDILADGRMYIIWWAPRGERWLTLSGIIFAPRSQGQNIGLVRHWRNYPGWRPFGATMYKNVVVLSGLIRAGQWNHFSTLPGNMRPVKRLIFSVCNHQYITRVDVANNGAVARAGGGASHHWVAMDGIVFSKYGGPKLSLAGGWRNYQGAFRHARAHRVGPLCLVSGLVRNDARDWSLPQSHHLTTLPATCRPAGDLLFGCNSHNPHWPVQLKVAPSGKVTYAGGKTGAPWVSLDCIHFVPKDAM